MIKTELIKVVQDNASITKRETNAENYSKTVKRSRIKRTLENLFYTLGIAAAFAFVYGCIVVELLV